MKYGCAVHDYFGGTRKFASPPLITTALCFKFRNGVAMNEHEYTFLLPPGGKSRYNAGPYDQEMRSPRYEIEVLIPNDMRYQVEIKQFLMGTVGNHIWVWDLRNEATLPAFITIKNDGVIVKSDGGGGANAK